DCRETARPPLANPARRAGTERRLSFLLQTLHPPFLIIAAKSAQHGPAHARPSRIAAAIARGSVSSIVRFPSAGVRAGHPPKSRTQRKSPTLPSMRRIKSGNPSFTFSPHGHFRRGGLHFAFLAQFLKLMAHAFQSNPVAQDDSHHHDEGDDAEHERLRHGWIKLRIGAAENHRRRVLRAE